MRFLAVIPLALLSIGAAPLSQPGPPTTGTAPSKAPRAQALPGEILLTAANHCIDAEPRRTDGRTLGPRRLDRLPQGSLSLTVMRNVNGCPQPTTVREGYGTPAFRR
jgi:hypothetical protein